MNLDFSKEKLFILLLEKQRNFYMTFHFYHDWGTKLSLYLLYGHKSSIFNQICLISRASPWEANN